MSIVYLLIKINQPVRLGLAFPLGNIGRILRIYIDSSSIAAPCCLVRLIMNDEGLAEADLKRLHNWIMGDVKDLSKNRLGLTTYLCR